MAWFGSPTTHRSCRSPSQASSRRYCRGFTSWNSSTNRWRNRQRCAAAKRSSSSIGVGAQAQQVVEVDEAGALLLVLVAAYPRPPARPSGRSAAGRGRRPRRSRRGRSCRALAHSISAARSTGHRAGRARARGAMSMSTRPLRSSSVGGVRPWPAHRARSWRLGHGVEGAGRGGSRRPRRPSRSVSSPAALRVKVSARTWRGSAAPVAHPVGDAAGQHPGLARAGRGQDQRGRAVVVTASRCWASSPSSSASGSMAARVRCRRAVREEAAER